LNVLSVTSTCGFMLLEVHRVSKRFAGLEALRAVSLRIPSGSIYGLIGPNGAGKTTFFNLVTGVSPATSGIVKFRGNDITRARPHDIARLGVSRTYQLVRPFYGLSAIENVKVGILFGRPSSSLPVRDLDAEAHFFLTRVGLAEKANALIAELNLGERKRLEIAKALAAQPQLVLFDEVLAGLNPTETADAVRLLAEICSGGTTILMIEHNMQAIMSACQHIFVLHHGELIGEGAPHQISTDQRVIEAYLGRKDLQLERRKQARPHA
jgi:branched-chain amino acid transport system ATP-binding protein